MPAIPTWRNYVESTEEWLDDAALEKLRRAIPEMADALVQEIQSEVPEYARPLEGEFGRGIRIGTEEALRRFIGDESGESVEDVYRRLGAGEYNAGRSLDALQSAYRIGARVAWRQLSDAAAAAGASAQVQRNLAEAMFAYIDRLAGESVEGYAEAQLRAAGDLHRQRTRLAEMLVAGVKVSGAELLRAAQAARWPLPPTVACLAVAGERAERAGRGVTGDTLGLRYGETWCVIAPEPTRIEPEARRLAERLGLLVGLGPRVDLAQASLSMRLALGALELASAGSALVVADERLADIALDAAPEVVAALRERVLEPLAAQTPASRARLEATLLQWLRHHGSQGAVAAELAIHPQTVRYRMRRLRELMGGALDDPEQRFALQIALRGSAAPGRRG